MKVSIVRGGGIAGVNRTTAVESGVLSPPNAEELEARVTRAGIFDLPQDLAGTSRHPDEMSYALTVEDKGRTHTVLMTDSTAPDEVLSLIAWLDSVPGHEEEIGSARRKT
jgi:hypothetical protein